MPHELNPPRRNNMGLGFLLGIAVVALGVLAYLYYQQQREVVRIDVPGFSGTITKEPELPGIGKETDVEVKVD